MERRDFLKAAFGLGLGAVAMASAAKAAPLALQPLTTDGLEPKPHPEVQPAVADEKDLEQIKPEQVQWRYPRRRYWRRRYYRRPYYGYRRAYRRRLRRRYRRRYYW